VNEIAIIGAGFTGTTVAIQLLNSGAQKVSLIERRPLFGRGLAYSPHGDELLNVRASRMSAFPEDANHFVRWLSESGLGEPSDFAPRKVYGEYVSSLLDQTRASAGDRLEIVQGDALDVGAHETGVKVSLADGREISADAVVLALGNMPPADPLSFARPGLPPSVYVPDPWSTEINIPTGLDDAVVLVGTGLTMIDVALRLEDWGFRGKMIALSRRGLLPHAHGEAGPHAEGGGTLAGLALSTMVKSVKRRSGEIGWRAAVDELRPFTHDIWRSATPEEKERFLRHVRPWWDVHRHRVAPALAKRIGRLKHEGRLEVIAGKVQAAQASGEGVLLELRTRGSDRTRLVNAARIVNCTGPSGDIRKACDPLLAGLQRKGLIRPDRHRLGIEVDEANRAVGADGTPSSRVYAIGPIAKGSLWEVTAVPDLRVETAKLARRLADGGRASASSTDDLQIA
jgi:uncharacterized NAD(P)/FAD-binding protein YdhS